MKANFVFGLIFFFLLNTLGSIPQAKADLFLLPAPGSMVNLSPSYAPMLIKGLQVHPNNPLLFDFIVDTGNSGLALQGSAFKQESQKLIKYFLAALTINEDDLWVNLSPYEKDRIISKELGQTELGRDMLAQDYILKQLTASLIYPEKKLGQEFWDRVYTKAQEMYGTTQIPVNSFNKVWIVADKAKVLERNNTAYIIGAHLKVMLEEDYLALQKHNNKNLSFPNAFVGNPNTTHSITSKIIRQIILPELEKEVNQGKNFAALRQMFYSMILATWYKQALKSAFLNQIYSNKNKINALSSPRSIQGLSSPKSMQGMSSPNASIGDLKYIYQQYLKAYKKGVFNLIKEDVDASSKQIIPRKYFSGGLVLAIPRILSRAQVATRQEAQSIGTTDGSFAMITAGMQAEKVSKALADSVVASGGSPNNFSGVMAFTTPYYEGGYIYELAEKGVEFSRFWADMFELFLRNGAKIVEGEFEGNKYILKREKLQKAFIKPLDLDTLAKRRQGLLVALRQMAEEIMPLPAKSSVQKDWPYQLGGWPGAKLIFTKEKVVKSEAMTTVEPIIIASGRSAEQVFNEKFPDYRNSPLYNPAPSAAMIAAPAKEVHVDKNDVLLRSWKEANRDKVEEILVVLRFFEKYPQVSSELVEMALDPQASLGYYLERFIQRLSVEKRDYLLAKDDKLTPLARQVILSSVRIDNFGHIKWGNPYADIDKPSYIKALSDPLSSDVEENIRVKLIPSLESVILKKNIKSGVLVVEGLAGVGKSSLGKYIQKNGIAGIKQQDILWLDLDQYFPPVVVSEDGFFITDEGDLISDVWQDSVNHVQFESDINYALHEGKKLIVVTGFSAAHFFHNSHLPKPEMRVVLRMKDADLQRHVNHRGIDVRNMHEAFELHSGYWKGLSVDLYLDVDQSLAMTTSPKNAANSALVWTPQIAESRRLRVGDGKWIKDFVWKVYVGKKYSQRFKENKRRAIETFLLSDGDANFKSEIFETIDKMLDLEKIEYVRKYVIPDLDIAKNPFVKNFLESHMSDLVFGRLDEENHPGNAALALRNKQVEWEKVYALLWVVELASHEGGLERILKGLPVQRPVRIKKINLKRRFDIEKAVAEIMKKLADKEFDLNKLKGAVLVARTLDEDYQRVYLNLPKVKERLRNILKSEDIKNNFYLKGRLQGFLDLNLAMNAIGGIDLNAKHMLLDINKEGRGVEMNFNPAMIAEFKHGNFSGIVANIILITPIKSPLPLLGIGSLQ